MKLPAINIDRLNRLTRLMDIILTIALSCWLIFLIVTDSDTTTLLLVVFFLAVNIVLLITQPFQRLTSDFFHKKLRRD